MPPLPWALFWHPSKEGDAYSSPALVLCGTSSGGAKGARGSPAPPAAGSRAVTSTSPGSWGWDLPRMEPPTSLGTCLREGTFPNAQPHTGQQVLTRGDI